MSRPAPGPLPRTLPALDGVARRLEHWANAPRVQLGDLSIRQMVEAYGDGTPVWLTGSTVWMPAVFGLDPPSGNDADLIFSSESACDRFVQGVLSELNRRSPGFTFTKGTTAFGAARILLPVAPGPKRAYPTAQPPGVIDAWALGPGESVAEILMSYLHDYQRAAYCMNRSIAGSSGAVTRIARPVKRETFSNRY